MKKLICGLCMTVIMCLSFNIEVSALAEGYYMKKEYCELKGIQERCRPAEDNVCDPSAQTTCPEFLPE